jgi:5'-phosphate synthase pdxT subunit
MVKIGVLALQGSVMEHIRSLSGIEDVIPCEVKSVEDLYTVSGVILPGGESTTIGRLIRDFGLAEHLAGRIKAGMPVWGTCAGMILMAKEVVNEDNVHLGVMDISVRRNAYGGQLDSFNETAYIPEVSDEEIPLVFIRAPWVERIKNNVKILAMTNDRIVAVRQNHMLATSFHPELTDNPSFHRYFAQLVKSRDQLPALVSGY